MPAMQFCVQGAQPQSAGQLEQFSQDGLQVPSPHVDWQAPITHTCVHELQAQSAGQLEQFSQVGLQVPSPQVS